MTTNDYEAGADDQYCRVFYTFGISDLGKENYDEYKPDYKRGYAKWNGGLTCTRRPPGQRSKDFVTQFALRHAVSTSVIWASPPA